jgi:hypothetical protein
MTRVEEAYICSRNFAPERFSSRRQEKRVVLAPDRKSRRPVVAEGGVEGLPPTKRRRSPADRFPNGLAYDVDDEVRRGND